VSERSERTIMTVPKAHRCTIAGTSAERVHDDMVHL
jgi:hypothetical protein